MKGNLVNIVLIAAMMLSLFGPFKGAAEASPSPGNNPLAGLDSGLEYSPVFLSDLNPVSPAVNTIEKPEPNIYPELFNTVGIQSIQFDVFVTATFTDADGITVKTDFGIAEANDASTSGASDPADIPDPPDPPSNPFMDVQFGIGGSALQRDSRPLFGAPASATWDLRAKVSSDLLGSVNLGPLAVVSVTWSKGALPASYAFVIDDTANGGPIVNLRASPYYVYSTDNIGVFRAMKFIAQQNRPPSITVVFPNGGEIVGGVATVTAGASDPDSGSPFFDGVTSVTFDYSADSGSTWNPIGTAALTSGSSASGAWSASWNTSALSEVSTYRIRATAYDKLGASATDTSDSNFSISQILWSIMLNGSQILPITAGGFQGFADNPIAAASPFAVAGQDVLDIPNPPAPPADQYFDIWFATTGGNTQRDARPFLDPTIWPLRVKNQVGLSPGSSLVTITATYTNVPGSLAFVTITDPSTGISQNLRTSPVYTYMQSYDTTKNLNFTVKSNSPPAATVTFPNGGETIVGTINVTANVSDPDIAVGDFVTMVHFAYATSPYSVWTDMGMAAQAPTGTWSMAWNTFLIPEGNYKIKVTGTDSIGAAGSDTSDNPFSVIHQITTTSTWKTGWNMWSYPFAPNPTTNSGQLSDNISVGLFVFHYNPVSGVYDLTDIATTGWGYWTKVNSNTFIDMVGFPVTTPSYVLSAGNNWNQIGNPYNATVTWSNVTAVVGGVSKNITDAQAAGWMSQYIYDYDPVLGVYNFNGTATGKLVPMVAYWTKVSVPGLVLLIPKP